MITRRQRIAPAVIENVETPLAFNANSKTASLPQASASQDGFLSKEDFATFNGKESVLTFSRPLSRSDNTVSINAWGLIIASQRGGTFLT